MLASYNNKDIYSKRLNQTVELEIQLFENKSNLFVFVSCTRRDQKRTPRVG